MSETQAPPTPPAETTPAAAPAPAKKYLLDNPVLRAIFDIAAFVSPVPLLLVLINFWLSCLAPVGFDKQDANTVFRQIFEGSGQPPMWALPLAFIPGVLILILLHRKSSPKLLAALLCLLAAGSAEIFYFMQIAN